jgi:hypothetical protein
MFEGRWAGMVWTFAGFGGNLDEVGEASRCVMVCNSAVGRWDL